ncbi:MAG: carboxypeptidase-like regulatory domain-containing protein [Bacteroidetes bacterium]|nr:carboxypeptidase-like regulatory domain-containing protein [Bacteroidota bacterium]
MVPGCLFIFEIDILRLERLISSRTLIILFVMSFGIASAQYQKRIIQLSGVTIGSDSARAIPGVHVWVPKAGRGSITNAAGFFSLPVLVGDSVVISAVGYVKQHYIVPNHFSDFLTLVIEMVEDNTFLSQVTITPFPTEEVFKQAVLALNIPMDEGRIDQRNLNAELMALMVRTTPMDANMNYRYYMEQTSGGFTERFQPRTNPFLNPFNWAKFFRDLKKNRK